MPLSDGNPVRAGAAGARRRLHRRPEVLPSVRQRRHVVDQRRRLDRAATSSRSTDRRTWPTAAASRSCRRPAPCRNSRSRPRASTPADGHTAGATVNVTLKSGTNALKGEGYYYLPATNRCRRPTSSSTRAAARSRRSTTSAPAVRSAARSDPGLFDGHDRTFFFGAVEWLYDRFPEPVPQTVPTAGDAQRRLLGAARRRASSSTIRRPRSPSNGARRPAAVPRQHHSGQPHQPDRAERAELLPAAEPGRATPRAGTTTSPSTRARTTSTRSRRASITASPTSSRSSCATPGTIAARRATPIFGEVNGIVPTGNFLFRKNDGVTADHVYTMSSESLLRRARRLAAVPEPNVRQHEGLFDPASLGFSPAVRRPVRRRAATSRSSTSTRSATSATTSPGNTDAHDLLVPADLHADDRATTRCAPATTCGCTTSSARTRAGRRATT